MTFDEMKALDAAHHMPNYGRFPVALESGKGAVATDAHGRAYIDFGSGIGVNALGYCDPAWVEAVAGQAARLQHISNLYYSPVQVRLVNKLTAITGMEAAFLCNSGAEANECAIKLARKYSSDAYGPGRADIVTLVDSFHGRTMATLTATGQDAMHRHFDPFLPGFRYAQAGDLTALEAGIDEKVCAVMVECIQGEGGVKPLPDAYLREVAALCRARDILLIVDEVQTGVGRTGRFLACEHADVTPDILTLAKGLGGGLPIGACLCGDKLRGVLAPGTHGSTFGGNPICCAGALTVLDRVADDAFLGEVTRKGEFLRERLGAMPGIREVRGYGLMLGATLAAGDAREVAVRCVEKGLLILTAKDALRFLPPLTITEAEIEAGLAILQSCLAKMAEEIAP